MTKSPVCPETGKPMVRDSRPMTITYKGQSSTFDMPGWYCNESGESIHTSDDIKVSDAALRELKITVEHLLHPQEVRRIREGLSLTQREAGAIIGGGPNAFQKYEQGTVTVSKGISNFLRVLERHPGEIDFLKNEIGQPDGSEDDDDDLRKQA
jgi:HTH-type transcriptional regulator/antitoxin MqsA